MVVDDTFATFLECRGAEIHQKTERQLHQTQIGQNLLCMHGHVPLGRFQLNQQLVPDNNISPKSFPQDYSIMFNPDRFLPVDLQSMPGQGVGHQCLIYAFQQSRTKVYMQLVTAIHRNFGKPFNRMFHGLIFAFFAPSRDKKRKNVLLW